MIFKVMLLYSDGVLKIINQHPSLNRNDHCKEFQRNQVIYPIPLSMLSKVGQISDTLTLIFNPMAFKVFFLENISRY